MYAANAGRLLFLFFSNNKECPNNLRQMSICFLKEAQCGLLRFHFDFIDRIFFKLLEIFKKIDVFLSVYIEMAA